MQEQWGDFKMENNIPYADEVKFFADPKLKKLIYAKQKHLGKGWSSVQVGKHEIKTRDDPKQAIRKIQQEKYPTFQNVSLFSSLNYHAPVPNKITKYGSEKYMLQHSKLKKIGVFELEQPVKSGRKKSFGKVVKKVPLYDWDYSVINWSGSDPNLELSRKIISPFGNEKVMFSSGKVPKSRSNQLIKQLKQMAGIK